MKTIILKIDPNKPQKKIIKKAAEIIRKNGLAAFPTETVYGLGCSALSRTAALKVFAAKNRPPDNPLIVHLADVKDIPSIAYADQKKLELIKQLSPGPVTFLLRKRKIIPDEITAGSPKVAVRIPSHPTALALIRESGVPIAAPSANLSTKPSPTRAAHVIEDLRGKIDLILDGGRTNYGIESTIIDLTSKVPTVLRLGSFDIEELKKYFPNLKILKKTKTKVPGTQYKHYAPLTPMISVERKVLGKKVSQLSKQYKICVLCSRETGEKIKLKGIKKIILGSQKNLKEIAHNLFSCFRKLDKSGADLGIVERFEEKGAGLALMNRIQKAAQKTAQCFQRG